MLFKKTNKNLFCSNITNENIWSNKTPEKIAGNQKDLKSNLMSNLKYDEGPGILWLLSTWVYDRCVKINALISTISFLPCQSTDLNHIVN